MQISPKSAWLFRRNLYIVANISPEKRSLWINPCSDLRFGGFLDDTLGGIPHYLKEAKAGKSAVQNQQFPL